MLADDLYFTADTHFYHRAAAELWRPFPDIETMNEGIIEAWNDKVPADGIIFHLGDVGFWPDRDTAFATLHRLSGQLHVVWGNHDDTLRKWHRQWGDETPITKAYDIAYIKPRLTGGVKQAIMLAHYPMVTWRSAHHGAWHLHGHSHGSLDESLLPAARRLDVGVDPMLFRPVDFWEVQAMMQDMGFKPVDHHTEKK